MNWSNLSKRSKQVQPGRRSQPCASPGSRAILQLVVSLPRMQKLQLEARKLGVSFVWGPQLQAFLLVSPLNQPKRGTPKHKEPHPKLITNLRCVGLSTWRTLKVASPNPAASCPKQTTPVKEAPALLGRGEFPVKIIQ